MRRFVAGATFSVLLVFAARAQEPVIDSLVPNQTTAGRSTFTLRVTGAGFVRDQIIRLRTLDASPQQELVGSRVEWWRFGATTPITLPTTFISSTELNATVSSALVTNPGDVYIRVNNVRFTNATSQFVYFRINPRPQITTTSPLPVVVVGTVYRQLLAGTGGTPGYTWRISGGSLPSGLSLEISGVISGTPTTVGTSQFELTLEDTAGVTASRQFSLTVVSVLRLVTSSPLPPGVVGEAYSLQFQADGGTPTYQWRVVEGTPPEGLVLSAAGQLRGIPTQAGTFTFEVTVNDAGQQSTSRVFRITMAPRLVITSASPLPDAQVGEEYSFQATADGGTPGYSWRISAGTLPPGLSLNVGGLISGVPTILGAFQFELTLTDDAGATASSQFSLTVVTGPEIGTLSPLPMGVVGQAYSLQFQVIGGSPPYQWRVVAGSPPPGLALSATGQLSGTPTQTGTFTFQVSVIDGRQDSASMDFRVTITPRLEITSTSPLPDAQVGEVYSFPFAVTGGTPPYTWLFAGGSEPPEGLSLSEEGRLSGTPQTAGTFQFTISVFDTEEISSSKQFSLTVVPLLTIVTISPLPEGTVNAMYALNFEASGGIPPYTWSAIESSPPPEVSLADNGALTGTPTQEGTFTFQVRVVDSTNETFADGVFQLVVVRAALTIVTGPFLPPGAAGDPYSIPLEARGGTPEYSWTVVAGGPPQGVTLAEGGVLSGTPTAFGDFGFRVRVTDDAGETAEQNFAVSISAPPPPQASIQGLPPLSEPAQQPPFQMTLESPYPAAIEGRATLTFTPDAVVPTDDPAVQFTSGGRTLNFTVAPGETTAVVQDGQLAVQTGSVAGLIRVAAELSSSGVDLTPSPQPVQETRVQRAPPQIRSVDVSRTPGGFEVAVIGISTPREVTQAVFRFTPNPQADLRTPELPPIDISADFSDWYQSEASAAFGSAFRYRQSFTINGDANAVTGVTVILRNSQGDSQPATGNF